MMYRFYIRFSRCYDSTIASVHCTGTIFYNFQDAQEAFNTWIKDFHESKPVSVVHTLLACKSQFGDIRLHLNS